MKAKASPLLFTLRATVGVLSGWIIIQVLNLPLGWFARDIMVPLLRNTEASEGMILSLSLLTMIAIWTIICIIAGYVAAIIAGRRVVTVALITGFIGAWVPPLMRIQPDMLFTYDYLLPATVVYATTIGGALALASETVVDE